MYIIGAIIILHYIIISRLYLVSDTASKDKTKDQSGPILQSLFPSPQYHVVAYDVVPDDKDQIQKTIINWVDAKAFNVIITTGGTGFGVRDTTPEVHSPLFFSIDLYLNCRSLELPLLLP